MPAYDNDRLACCQRARFMPNDSLTKSNLCMALALTLSTWSRKLQRTPMDLDAHLHLHPRVYPPFTPSNVSRASHASPVASVAEESFLSADLCREEEGPEDAVLPGCRRRAAHVRFHLRQHHPLGLCISS